MKLFVLIIFCASIGFSSSTYCRKPPSEELLRSLMSIKSIRKNFDSFNEGLTQKETENEKQVSSVLQVNSQVIVIYKDDKTADSVMQDQYSHSIDSTPATVELTETGSNISGRCDMATHIDCNRDYKYLGVLSAYVSLICSIWCVLFSPLLWLYGILYVPRVDDHADLDEKKLRKKIKKLKLQQSQTTLQ